jgi:hypothetical protein
MTFEKAKRILPSFVLHCANGINDLSVLRKRVEGETRNIETLLLDALAETHTGSFRASKAFELDRKHEQLTRFLEAIK